MSNKEKVIARVRELCPETMELTIGCKLEKIFWYKTEEDKKEGNVDWFGTGHHQYGRDGVVVKDLRSDFLPMWIDCGDQLEFQVQPNDIVSYEILGHPLTLQNVLRAIYTNRTGIKRVITDDGYTDFTKEEKELVINLLRIWNIYETAENQSPEVFDFLLTVLEK